VSSLIWIEGEATSKSSFSESQVIPGCSAVSALVLRSLIEDTSHFASFKVPAKYPGDLDVWVAARLPSGTEKNLLIDVGGQLLRCQGDAIAPYGQGFAWYRFGKTKINVDNTIMTILADVPIGTEIAIDAITLSPPGFIPEGPLVPEMEVPGG
jgi:hypothetical protein